MQESWGPLLKGVWYEPRHLYHWYSVENLFKGDEVPDVDEFIKPFTYYTKTSIYKRLISFTPCISLSIDLSKEINRTFIVESFL